MMHRKEFTDRCRRKPPAPPPRKVTGSSQRSPLHAAGSGRRLHFGKCACKRQDIVGLYVDPPAHAIVLSVDEKSQIQALDRT
jgi:hypothetical protein